MSKTLELARQKLTFALDIQNWSKAMEIASLVAPYVRRIKLGPVLSLARAAQKADLDGVVASVHETPLIRKACGPNLRIVTPGVRPLGADAGDQKRLAHPRTQSRQDPTNSSWALRSTKIRTPRQPHSGLSKKLPKHSPPRD